LLAGIAAALAVPRRALDDALPNGNDGVIVLDPLSRQVHYQDAAAYAAAWAELDVNVLAPLEARLRRFQLDALEVVTTSAFGTFSWRATPFSSWLAVLSHHSWPAMARQLAVQADANNP
jgi:hypothetical protein